MKIFEIIEKRKARVGQVMEDTAEKSSVIASTTVRGTLQLIATRHNSAMVVMDPEKTVIGIVTEKDIIVALEKYGESALDMEVSSIMTTKPVKTDKNAPCRDVLVEMIDGNFRNMPVYDEDEFVGIVQILEIAEGKLSEILDENRKLRELIRRLVPESLFCNLEDDISKVHNQISDHNLPCVPVLSSHNVAGIISDRDFLTLIGGGDLLKSRTSKSK
jgi:CBS domain-containing protein